MSIWWVGLFRERISCLRLCASCLVSLSQQRFSEMGSKNCRRVCLVSLHTPSATNKLRNSDRQANTCIFVFREKVQHFG